MKIFQIVILSVLGFTFCSCIKTKDSQLAPLQKVKVAFTTQPQGTLVHIALTKGYFLEEGLEIQPTLLTYGKAALEEVLKNRADIATAAETPIMFNILNGEKIQVFANIVASNNNNGIVARRDAGIITAKDLRGKKIGFTFGTSSDFFLTVLLVANGMQRKDIIGVALPPEAMHDALINKKVDAVSTWNFPLTQIKHELGSNGLAILDKEIYTETYNIVAQQEYIKNNPIIIQRFLRALIKAELFVRAEPEAAQEIISVSSKRDKILVHEVWNAFQYHVGLDEILLITLEDETRWAISNNLTQQKKMPNYMPFIYFDGLKVVRPESIRIKK